MMKSHLTIALARVLYTLMAHDLLVKLVTENAVLQLLKGP